MMMSMIQAFRSDYQTGNSDFQFARSVLVLHGITHYGMYLQGLRELFGRTEAIQSILDTHQENLWRLRSLCWKFWLMPARRRLEHNKLLRRLHDDERRIKETMREINSIYAHCVALKDSVGELTPARREELSHELWVLAAKQNAAVDLFASGRIGSGTLNLLIALPPPLRSIVWNDIGDTKTLMEWYKTYEPPALMLPDTTGKPLQIEDVLEEGGRTYLALVHEDSGLQIDTVAKEIQ